MDLVETELDVGSIAVEAAIMKTDDVPKWGWGGVRSSPCFVELIEDGRKG